MKFCEKKYVQGENRSTYGAFSFDEAVEFKLYIPRRCGTSGVCMHLYGEGLENKLYKRFDFEWVAIDGSNDVYSCLIDMSKIGVGLYYYKYEIVAQESAFYGCGEKVSELSPMKSDGNGMIQLLIFHESSSSAKWLRGGIMYQIFVDRFKKSGRCKPKPTAVMNDDWYGGTPQFAPVPGGYVENNMFFGGDLYGVIEKLDYIKSLGVTCIYLCPIFDAYSNHKYDTGDYMSVDPMFGSEEALDELISEAKKREIYIILDGVFNHTGADSIYFNKNGTYGSLGAYQSKESPYFEWYNFRKYPNDYECWWNVKILPRVNSDCPSYQNYILGVGGVVEKWMKKGIRGFRLDVADELSDNFLKRLNSKVKSIDPDGVVYGEVWEDASNKIAYDKRKKYFLGNELDSVMNYPLKDAVISYVKNGDFQGFCSTCNMLYSHYPKHNADLLMNLLGTHDTERILTVLGGESSEGYSNQELSKKRMSKAEIKQAVSMLKLAYTIISTVPGVPCIYYGDEAGMEGHRDPFNRMPYPWGKENKSLVEFYQKVGKIRRNEPIFKDGFFKIIRCDSDVLAFARYNEKGFALTVVNRSEHTYRLDSNVDLFSYESGRKISVFKPNSACVLKGKADFLSSKIEFYK